MSLKLQHYSALAAAFLAARSETDAQIIYTDIQDTTFRSKYSDTASYYLDLNGDGIADFQIKNEDYSSSNGDDIWATSAVYILPLSKNEVGHSNQNVNNLNCGNPIDDDLLWVSQENLIFRFRTERDCSSSAKDYCKTFDSERGKWKINQDGFCPVRLIEGSDTSYGWIRIKITKPDFVYCTIKDYAFEASEGQPLNAGQMPCKDEKDSLPSRVFVCASPGSILTDDKSPCLSFQWYKNGTPIDTAQNNLLHVMTNGNYFVVSQDEYGCVDTSTICTVTTYSNPPKPTITQQSDTLFSTSGPSYEWFDGGADDFGMKSYNWFVPPWNSCYYKVVVSDSNQCSSQSDYFAYVNPYKTDRSLYQNFVFNQWRIKASTIEICGSETFNLLVNNEDWICNVQWMKNGADIPFAIQDKYTADSSGLYYCKMSTSANTFYSDSVYLKYLPIPTISQKQDTLISSPGLSYQWLLNASEIPSATNQTFVYRQPGSYAVRVKLSDSCTSQSEPVNIIYTSIASTTIPGLPIIYLIHSKLIAIKFPNSDFLQGKIRIIDALGRTVNTVPINGDVIQIPFNSNETGWFVLDIEKDEHRFFSPILIF